MFQHSEDASGSIEMTSFREDISEHSKTTCEVVNERKHHSKHSKKRTIKTKTNLEVTSLENKFSYQNIIGITIHQTDNLNINSFVIHPVVKIHIVDYETGEYLKKSDSNRSVVHYYEDKQYPFIGPMLTHSFDLQTNKTLVPAWNETVIINEDIDYIIESKRNVIIFFQIMDFLDFSSVNQNKKGGY